MKMTSGFTSPRLLPPYAFFAALVVAAWLSLILILGGQGLFHAAPDQAPYATLGALIGPPFLFLVLIRLSTFRSWVLAIDPVWLVAVQGLRILGAGFLFMNAYGHLPALFAYPAGWGDILVAVLAPFVATRLARDPAFIRSKLLFGFHVLGMLDFMGAVLSGLLARGTLPFLGLSESTSALGELPLLLIPCFAVPLWICLHIAAFTQIREANNNRHAGFKRGQSETKRPFADAGDLQ